MSLVCEDRFPPAGFRFNSSNDLFSEFVLYAKGGLRLFASLIDTVQQILIAQV